VDKVSLSKHHRKSGIHGSESTTYAHRNHHTRGIRLSLWSQRLCACAANNHGRESFTSGREGSWIKDLSGSEFRDHSGCDWCRLRCAAIFRSNLLASCPAVSIAL